MLSTILTSPGRCEIRRRTKCGMRFTDDFLGLVVAAEYDAAKQNLRHVGQRSGITVCSYRVRLALELLEVVSCSRVEEKQVLSKLARNQPSESI